ncbi:replication restart DNA helicase PriA [Desulfuromusa kysingii]|uniref:Replication restart protein PriA n=1 Tax=Desulfuromusa kysingii TaxID=37625 RepID=A0A1H3W0A1_9BACT|nr:primosomal protein N' [Desulfuromusa kysingii]SDZ80565.1 replication restart DNA helicase PriA [Desulfuromusa kysingii]
MSDFIADIAVNIPLKQLFSYRIPESLVSSTDVGMRVKIPFGRRLTVGFILSIRNGDAAGLKDLQGLFEDEPILSSELIKLLRWAADYYCHPIGQVVRTALPAALGNEKTTVKIRTEAIYQPLDPEIKLRGKTQQELLTFIIQEKSVGLTRIREQFSAPHAALKRLVEVGALQCDERELCRDPFRLDKLPVDQCITLNSAQSEAVDRITSAIDDNCFSGFLLHGVTGSGKTEVYLHSVDQCLAAGRQALVLVPEISLTPQLVSRFRARFELKGIRIAVLHSGLSSGERYDAWREIMRNQIQIVIGARSAVFAPLQNLGLIVVDEEHESSYKQAEGFRYNARDLALVRGQQQHCPVLLGSATPSFASYYRSEQGALTRLTLDKRVHAGDLPKVEIIDLKEQVCDGELSNVLIEAIQQALEQQEQVLLLLNRRGFAPFLLCADCGETFCCPNCEITLTYHQQKRELRCHYCDYVDVVPESCHKCQGLNIEPQGAGTEKLEEELEKLFPSARIKRMDRDTTSRKGAHQNIMTEMMARKIDILVGTQMIAKGHDFPGVSLVGVLAADSTLNIPDFRSGERSFSLFTQVAGRAGRASGGGKVYIQSYNPEHYALTCAAEQDYHQFYLQELPFRQELGYPPCGHLVNLVFSGNNNHQVQAAAKQFSSFLFRVAGSVEILGPSPCPLARLRGKSRYQILLKAAARPDLRRLLNRLDEQIAQLPRQVTLHIDVDPIDML